jgi:lipopolysaccharide/colanic/teichoic acid biosynthesis glycosyltransferase
MVPTAYRSAIPRSGDSPALRRLLDLIISGFLILLLSPIFAYVCWRISRTSPGPVFFRQKRVGRDGQLFNIWKFRTMYVDADRQGPSVTSADDCRVTPIGRWLRDHKVDELPQLINVFTGDMSLVGPRPQVPRFVEHFDTSLRHVVLAVRPGITGPTTLHFRDEERLLADKPNREEYYIQQILPTKLAMDVHYVQTRRLYDDMRVLGETIKLFTIALGRKAVHWVHVRCLRNRPNRQSLEDHDLRELDELRRDEDSWRTSPVP